MTREIKFRAWDKQFRRMNYFDSGKSGIQYMFGEMQVSSGYDSEDQPTYKEDTREMYVLMQYTGLKDKNGKEIYEGDIVKVYAGYDGDFSIKEHVAPVEWDVDSWYVRNMTDDRWNGVEVIGDIYSNPELLSASPQRE